VARAGAAIEEACGPVEVWVNTAMLTSFSPFTEMPAAEFDRIVETTLLGVVNGTRTALSLMQHRGRGRIVTAGSGLAYRSVPYQSAYCASKHGINGFMASIRSELIRSKSDITLSLVQLPALNTPQFSWARNRMDKRPQPAPPIFQPEVAGRAILRAVKEGGREYFVGRSVLKLIFGTMVLPDWLDRKMASAGADMQKSRMDEPGGRPDNLETPEPETTATARGVFNERAESSAVIVDADRARLVAFGTLPVAGLVIGVVLGLLG
jgi:short-subunit dehydrogenase